MELAEPRVRSGVWEHTTFRVNPILRLRRTGLAAMVTIYGPRRPRKRALRCSEPTTIRHGYVPERKTGLVQAFALRKIYSRSMGR